MFEFETGILNAVLTDVREPGGNGFFNLPGIGIFTDTDQGDLFGITPAARSDLCDMPLNFS